MKTKEVSIEAATRDQLAAFATTNLGIAVARTDTAATLRAKVRTAWGKETFTVTVEEEPPAAPAEKPAPAVPAATQLRSRGGRNDPVAKIQLFETEEEGGKRPVYVSVNGVAMLIPRNQVVEIPYRYLEALKNATRTIYTVNETTNDPTPRDVPAYPHQVFAMPSPAEIEAWVKRADRFAA